MKFNMDILNNGAAIRIVNAPLSPIDILKDEIKFVTVIKTNIIKFDIGAGALGNIFVPYANVVNPATANPEALRDSILAMLTSSGTGGTGGTGGLPGNATEAKQDAEINLLNSMNATLSTIQSLSAVEVDTHFYEPIRIDDTGANLVYKGYAATGTLESTPSWAIERISIINGVEVHQWVNGGKSFANLWTEREALTYK